MGVCWSYQPLVLGRAAFTQQSASIAKLGKRPSKAKPSFILNLDLLTSNLQLRPLSEPVLRVLS